MANHALLSEAALAGWRAVELRHSGEADPVARVAGWFAGARRLLGEATATTAWPAFEQVGEVVRLLGRAGGEDAVSGALAALRGVMIAR
jgi:hypothetical protein